MSKKIRRTKTITPVVINRTTKTFAGFSFMTDEDDNVTLTAHWLVPREDGTVDKASFGVDAAPIQALSGFDAIVDAIVAASA
jgi:hypothetical protein